MTMKDWILYPAFSIICLLSSALTLTFSVTTFFRIYRGSKSQFAYLLLLFTFCYGLYRLGWFILNIVYQKNPENKSRSLVYSSITISYFFLLLSLQQWIFSMKYILSATEFSFTPTCASPRFIKIMDLTGVIFIALFTLICYIIAMIRFYRFDDFENFY